MRHREIKLCLLIAVFMGLACGCGPSDGPHREVSTRAQGGSDAAGAVAGIGFDQVRPLLIKYCSECHPAKMPADWTIYSQARDNAANLYRRVSVERSMPQVGSRQAAEITEAERVMLGKWVQAGAPEKATQAAAPITARSLPDVNSTSSGAEQQCTGCHGARGAQPQNVTIPRLAGQSSTYLVRQLSAFYWVRRKDLTSPPSGTNMNRISLELNDRTMASLADYFADQLQAKGASISEFDPQLITRGGAIAEARCNMCHMNQHHSGKPNTAEVPALAGQSDVYITVQLLRYKRGERQHAMMQDFSRELSELDMKALGAFYSTRNSTGVNR